MYFTAICLRLFILFAVLIVVLRRAVLHCNRYLHSEHKQMTSSRLSCMSMRQAPAYDLATQQLANERLGKKIQKKIKKISNFFLKSRTVSFTNVTHWMCAK